MPINLCVCSDRRIHRLQVAVGEIKLEAVLGFKPLLGIDEFQFITGTLHVLGAGLGTDADPVNGARHLDRAVGFDGDLEALVMEGGDEG